LTFDIGEKNFESLVREGIMAAKDGRIGFARRMLIQATQLNPFDARPWLWLSQTTEDVLERRGYLEKAIVADPSNSTARRGFAILTGILDEAKVLPEGQGVKPLEPEKPQDASGRVFVCPNCGGRTQFDPNQEELVCEYCGYRNGEVSSAPPEDQLMDLVLPTTQGHRWAEAAHMLACQKCGAKSLIAVGEKTISCPYCGSNQIIESEETQELIQPQAIGLFSLGKEQILTGLKEWFHEGWSTPDDLRMTGKQLDLRPAYYPFWIFSGTLEARWSCEVREGSGQSSRWIPQRGTEVLMFDDILAPGLAGLPTHMVDTLKPFRLDELRAFSPDQLAGWPALAYNRSMADASLLARESVVRDARTIIARRVAVSNERRSFEVGGGKWSGMTFKLALLPLWVGTYRYKNQVYNLMINGQTGKVVGDKPKDQVKVAMIWAAGLGTIIVIGLIALLVMLILSG
jgi:DNA-directed RNA polymerase subunit RPC12/RpoP